MAHDRFFVMQNQCEANYIRGGLIRLMRTAIHFGALSLLVSCASSPHVIELRSGRELNAMNEPEYKSKTGYFRYVDQDGRDAMVRADDVLHIVELED